jgi:hypothetical protein
MKDEEKQALQSVDYVYKQFSMNMKITQEEAIEINVLNNDTFEQYRQIINQAFLTQHDCLRLFDEPFDLFDYLIHHSEEVVVSDGRVEF